ncbi:hypothetical protein AVEN_222778-1 [Araneus ventricosus]|uniref:Uncharacterized protein n=1 Tax=Araneus ventricosus TaxID=182803 RepID=A0A4Y2B2N9_ARAVE|nr:hypothetical protein AVEN_222778-1 [Araneus ventricosus]
MTRYIHAPSLKARLARWQACSGTVQDGGNAREEFLCVGICEVFFDYERSACIPTQIRKSCTWSFVVCTRDLICESILGRLLLLNRGQTPATSPQSVTPLLTSAPHQRSSPSIPVDPKPIGRLGGRGLWTPHQRKNV